MTKPRSAIRYAAGPALLLILLAGWQDVALATGVAPGTVRYTGRATVLRASALVLTSTTKVVVADTGEMNPTGETQEETIVTFQNPAPLAINSRTLTAYTAGINNTSAASAAIENLSVVAGGVRITADVVDADSFATCHPESSTVSWGGGATIVNLRINNTPVNWTPARNKKIVIPGVATVILNEQFNPDVNSIVVNAVHVIVPGVTGVARADVVIAHAESGIFTCAGL